MSKTYASAGVHIDAGNELVRRIKKIVGASSSAIGGFSGLFPLPEVAGGACVSACCDGVGTKLKLAFLLDRHDTVGIDLVAMNVNDLVCSGSRPLFFLDYFACGKLDLDVAESVIRGIHRGCREAGCALLGGETAEMPGFYKDGEYDLAGFAVGIAEKNEILDPQRTKPGDVVIGLPSSGPHSNGYSLIRAVLGEKGLREFGGELLRPTRIYVKEVLSLLRSRAPRLKRAVKGIAHITGGGWPENIPRVLPKGLEARLSKGRWPVPDIFSVIQKRGRVSDSEMYRTFNMGIGLVLVLDPKALPAAGKHLGRFHVLGGIFRGQAGVRFV